MSSKNLSGIEDTLFIPMMARIYVSKWFPDYFYDQKAISLEGSLPQNIITEKSNEYTMLASTSRAVVMDKMVADFVTSHEKPNVVCIGCGLETMAFRLQNLSPTAHFYEVDFEQVIEQRRTVLGGCQNETLIAGDATVLDFAQHMDCTLPTIFVVAGVFQYFRENVVLALITRLKKQFTCAQMIFDATDKFGIKYAARYVKKTGNKNAMMYFYINDPKAFVTQANIRLISVSGFFGNISKPFRKKLKLYTRIATKIADNQMHAMILRVGL